jgi:transcriptional regulator with XRE-family HTH domain
MGLLLHFGAAVRKLRKAKGLSQETLALESELDRAYVGAIERGQKNPSLLTIGVLAQTMGVQLDELFSVVLVLEKQALEKGESVLRERARRRRKNATRRRTSK